MFTGDTLRQVVDHLILRNASIFHACQLQDIPSYVALGGIPSHSHLEAHQQRYTPMDTDNRDKQNRIWDKVFVNLGDFGRIFAHGKAAAPTAYGPITIQLYPETLLEADDVACICRTATK